MIWIPIVIAALALMRCIVLEKRLKRINARVRNLRDIVEQRAKA